MCACVSVCMSVSDQMGYQLDMKKTKIVCKLILPKRADLVCPCQLWNGLQVLGYLNNLTTLDYAVNLRMSKATVYCLSDTHGVCSLMNNLEFPEMRVGPRGKTILMGA